MSFNLSNIPSLAGLLFHPEGYKREVSMFSVEARHFIRKIKMLQHEDVLPLQKTIS
jgi:hypothetical protein